MYRWWVFLHLVGVFGFLLAHGVSVAVAFRLRKERDPKRVQALLAVSSASINAFYPAVVLLLVGGVAATFAGDLWGYGWIWASIVLLILVSGAMYSVARPYYRRLRFITDAMVDGSEAVSADQYAEALRSRQLFIAGIGFAGLLLILYLMLFKPTLGMSPQATPPAAAGEEASLVASELAFDSDLLTVPASRGFGLSLDNRASGVLHNVAISDRTGRKVFTGETFPGPARAVYSVPALEPGTYVFLCDVHPQQMTGTLVAR
ncbi:MAG TPA: DUF2269 family protein [Actinomycetota bacterium]|nr:DUF2269 family protein [Actinomycetota bacterium]